MREYLIRVKLQYNVSSKTDFVSWYVSQQQRVAISFRLHFFAKKPKIKIVFTFTLTKI
jgi:hypothetical protein